MALQHAQRKMKIAHYGRSKSAKFERVVPLDPSTNLPSKTSEEEKRCSFITPNSGIWKNSYFSANWFPLLILLQCANLSASFAHRSYLYCLSWWRMGSSSSWWQV